jgi:hypothetical protein
VAIDLHLSLAGAGVEEMSEGRIAGAFDAIPGQLLEVGGDGRQDLAVADELAPFAGGEHGRAEALDPCARALTSASETSETEVSNSL